MAIETLGEVRAPSGIVLIVDMGLLDLWCHDRPPVLPGSGELLDYRLDGADAERAGQLFDRWVFDIPRADGAAYEAAFSELVTKHALNARLVVREARVTHLERARLASADGAGEFPMHGVQLVAVHTGPVAALRVIGERRGFEPYAHCWSWVALEVAPGETATRVPAGPVAVDKARLMFIDVEALGAWRHWEPTDGRADFVFWGRDAEAAAERFGAPKLPEEPGCFGVVDLDVAEAARRGQEIEAAKAAGQYRLATDFRPHSHHYHLHDYYNSPPANLH